MSRATKYSQVIVKASAERSRLLSREYIRDLAEYKSLNEMISQLRGTVYGHLLGEAENLTADRLQYLLKEEFVRVYGKILAYSPSEIREMLESYLRYLEVENLEILIRMKSMKAPYESIIDMLHLSVEDILRMKNKFIQAAKANDIKSAIEAFRDTIYESALSEGLRRYEETGSTRFFNFSLSRFYFDNLLESARSLPKEDRDAALILAGIKVDTFNIAAIIRSKILNYPPHLTFWTVTKHFHLLSEEQVRSMVSSDDVNSVLDHVRTTYYGRFLASRRSIEETLMSFERNSEDFILRKIIKKRIAEPFTIASPLDIILRKEAEMKNLILISSGIEFRWKPEDIVSLLI